MKGACLFGAGAVPQLDDPGRGGGASVWVSQWFAVRRKGGRGVAGLSPGCVELTERGCRGWERVVLGPPSLGAGDGGAMEQRERGGGVPRLPGELGA